MAQETVNHNGIAYIVETATDTFDLISREVTTGEFQTAVLEEGQVSLGLGVDTSKAVNERLIIGGRVIFSSQGSPFVNANASRLSLQQGGYDESKRNDANFSDYMKWAMINLVFLKKLEIEPIDMADGTVKVEFQ